MKILVSACLLGYNVKYNGKNNYNEELNEFLREFDVVPICPEVLGGLKIPRYPSEIRNEKVFNSKNEDVTEYFIKGAERVLEIANKNDIKVAILKSNSPSCGSRMIYDGSFSHKLISGKGILTKVLIEHGLVVLDEESYKEYRW